MTTYPTTCSTDEATYEQAVDEMTRAYLGAIDPSSTAPADAASGLLKYVAEGFMARNAGVPDGEGWAVPEALDTQQLARLVMRYNDLFLLPGGDGADALYIRQGGGQDKGACSRVYAADVLRLIEAFQPEASLAEMWDVEEWLYGCADLR